MARPTAGTTGGHVAALFVLWGDERATAYFRKLHENQIKLLGGNSVVAEAVAGGTADFGLTDNDDIAAMQCENGKLEAILPDQDSLGTLLIPTTVSLVANAKHPEDAKRLVDYLLSKSVEQSAHRRQLCRLVGALRCRQGQRRWMLTTTRLRVHYPPRYVASRRFLRVGKSEPDRFPAAARAQWSAAVVWSIVAICCAVPLIWVVAQIALNPTTLAELRIDSFRLALLGRTLAYNGSVAIVATLLAVPAAIALGRGRGVGCFGAVAHPADRAAAPLAGYLVWLGSVNSIDRHLARTRRAGGYRSMHLVAGDVALAGAGDRHGPRAAADGSQVQQQALLDGVAVARDAAAAAGPAIASTAIVAVLAVQEFAVYEPTGISVVATEMRMVFETGAFQLAGQSDHAADGSGRLGRRVRTSPCPISVPAPRPRWRRRCRCSSSSPFSRSSRSSRRENSPSPSTSKLGTWPRTLDAPAADRRRCLDDGGHRTCPAAGGAGAFAQATVRSVARLGRVRAAGERLDPRRMRGRGGGARAGDVRLGRTRARPGF